MKEDELLTQEEIDSFDFEEFARWLGCKILTEIGVEKKERHKKTEGTWNSKTKEQKDFFRA